MLLLGGRFFKGGKEQADAAGKWRKENVGRTSSSRFGMINGEKKLQTEKCKTEKFKM